jgi:hypothetical protein
MSIPRSTGVPGSSLSKSREQGKGAGGAEQGPLEPDGERKMKNQKSAVLGMKTAKIFLYYNIRQIEVI